MQLTDPNGNKLWSYYDKLGRKVAQVDAGNYLTRWTLDAEGHVTEERRYTTAVAAPTSTTTPPTGTNNAADRITQYAYDRNGNRLSEVGTSTINGGAATTWKNQSATYDALGRLKTWNEAGTTNSPASSTTYAYDAMGNVRRTTANYRALDGNGTAATTATTKDYWFRYDNMNRLVVDRGILSGGTIVRNGGDLNSTQTLYDKAGRRTAVLRTTYVPPLYIEVVGNFPGYSYEEREIYTYNTAGRLAQIDVTQGASVTETAPYVPAPTVPPAPTTGGVKRASFAYDAMGRMTLQQDYEYDGTTVAYDRAIIYNAKNQIQTETTIVKRVGTLYKSVNTYDYGTGANYALGSVVSLTSKNYQNNNDAAAKDTSTVNAYTWRDGAMQSTITFDSDTGSSSNTLHTTTMYYDAAGRLTSANIADGKPRSVAYTLDENAQIIRRDETKPSNLPVYQTGSPHEVWYRFGGREMGYVGNNGNNDPGYTASTAERQDLNFVNLGGTFRNGVVDAHTYTDFAQSYDPINSYSQGAAGGSYTVRTGDTLQSVAQAVWGDSSLWYKLAEANGITGNAGLIEGQVLQLPAGVIRNRHNATTANPYNPAEAIGDLSPTMAAPPKKAKGCGGLGTILMAVVAVAVTIVATAGAASVLTGASLSSSLGAVTGGTMVGLTGSAGALTSIGAVGVGMAGAAIGSVASQAFGVATGIQDKFSWKGVGLSALSGGVTAGLGSSFGGDWAAAAARGAVSSAISQGVGVATGLQSKFDFAGVAATGIGAGVASFAGARTAALGTFGNRLAANTAGAIANAATRSAINGESFGDNLMRALPNAIGNTIGNLVAEQIGGPPRLAYSDVNLDNTIIGGANGDQLAMSGGLAVGGARQSSGTGQDPVFGWDWSGSGGGGSPSTGWIESNGEIVVQAEKQPAPRYYLDDITGGQTINSYTPSVLRNWGEAIAGRRSVGLEQISRGGLGYITGPIEYALSPFTGTLDIQQSYYRGRQGWVAPADIETTNITMTVAGGIEGGLVRGAMLARTPLAAGRSLSAPQVVHRKGCG